MKDTVRCFTIGQCIVLAIIVTGTVCHSDVKCNNADRNIRRTVLTGTDESSFSQKLWRQSLAKAQKVLNTDFFQQIRTGVLNPKIFGAHGVQHAILLEKQSDALMRASQKEQSEQFNHFLKVKAMKYKRDAVDMSTDWQLSASSCVQVDKACQRYSNYKIDVADNYDPKYSVIELLPHLRLRKWIVDQMKNGPHDFGVYTEWANEDVEDYEKYELMVDRWFDDGEIIEDTAHDVYASCMDFEFHFHDSLVPQ